MSYMSAFEYQSKSSVSISDLNKLRKHIKLGKNNLKDIKPVFEEIINIFKEKKIDDLNMLISFNLRKNEDSYESTIYQLYRTIQDVFKEKDTQLNEFITLLEKVINEGRDNIDNNDKTIIIKYILDIIMAIDNDIIEFKHSEENNNLFTSKGF